MSQKLRLGNFATGAITRVEALQAEDSVDVQVDINGEGSAEFIIAFSSLTKEEQNNWKQLFHPLKTFVALDNDEFAWNVADSLPYAGFINKVAVDIALGTIRIQTVELTEYLKARLIINNWNTVTDPNYSLEFSGATWGDIMVDIAENAFAIDLDAPSDAPKPPQVLGKIPSRNDGTLKHVVKATDIVTYYDALTDIRDNISSAGNEFRFVPYFVDASRSKVAWEFIVGGEGNGHINESNIITLPLNETTHFSSYSTTIDSNEMYSKLYIQTIEGDEETPSDLSSKYHDDFPVLVERFFSPNVELTADEKNAQFDARLKSSTDATHSIEALLEDEPNPYKWIRRLGSTINMIGVPDSISAGHTFTVRLIAVSWTPEVSFVKLEVMQPQARYPKLPNQPERDIINDTPTNSPPLTTPSTGIPTAPNPNNPGIEPPPPYIPPVDFEFPGDWGGNGDVTEDPYNFFPSDVKIGNTFLTTLGNYGGEIRETEYTYTNPSAGTFPQTPSIYGLQGEEGQSSTVNIGKYVYMLNIGHKFTDRTTLPIPGELPSVTVEEFPQIYRNVLKDGRINDSWDTVDMPDSNQTFLSFGIDMKKHYIPEGYFASTTYQRWSMFATNNSLYMYSQVITVFSDSEGNKRRVTYDSAALAAEVIQGEVGAWKLAHKMPRPDIFPWNWQLGKMGNIVMSVSDVTPSVQGLLDDSLPRDRNPSNFTPKDRFKYSDFKANQVSFSMDYYDRRGTPNGWQMLPPSPVLASIREDGTVGTEYENGEPKIDPRFPLAAYVFCYRGYLYATDLVAKSRTLWRLKLSAAGLPKDGAVWEVAIKDIRSTPTFTSGHIIFYGSKESIENPNNIVFMACKINQDTSIEAPKEVLVEDGNSGNQSGYGTALPQGEVYGPYISRNILYGGYSYRFMLGLREMQVLSTRVFALDEEGNEINN